VRFVLVIVSLAAITVVMVHLRREEIRARHELQRLQAQQVQLRRRLYDQQVELGKLTAPQEVRRRAADMAVGLTDRNPAAVGLAGREGSEQR